jgi:hypothetical protein
VTARTPRVGVGLYQLEDTHYYVRRYKDRSWRENAYSGKRVPTDSWWCVERKDVERKDKGATILFEDIPWITHPEQGFETLALAAQALARALTRKER